MVNQAINESQNPNLGLTKFPVTKFPKKHLCLHLFSESKWRLWIFSKAYFDRGAMGRERKLRLYYNDYYKLEELLKLSKTPSPGDSGFIMTGSVCMLPNFKKTFKNILYLGKSSSFCNKTSATFRQQGAHVKREGKFATLETQLCRMSTDELYH